MQSVVTKFLCQLAGILLIAHPVLGVTLTEPLQVKTLKFVVHMVPNTPILDGTKPWPVIPEATIRVHELDKVVKTDQAGEATLSVPLGPSGRAVYTFEVTVPGSPYRSIMKRIISRGGSSNFDLLFHPKRDLILDYTQDDPR